MALVSILIPCYNAERWIGETIQSCLDQTFRPMEVIVVDDGSTDGSAEIVRQFGERVRLITGPNRGPSAARNTAFEASRGDVVMFTDADDILLAHKVKTQIEALERSGRDVAYSDWAHTGELTDSVVEGPDQTMGEPPDMLSALLSGWWCVPFVYLYRRSALRNVRWDEELLRGDDADFQMQVALSGASYVYVPGRCGLYRRHGSSQLSVRSMDRFTLDRDRVFSKVLARLETTGMLTEEKRQLLAEDFWECASAYYGVDRAGFERCLGQVRALTPRFRPQRVRYPLAACLATSVLGIERAEYLRSLWRRVKKYRKPGQALKGSGVNPESGVGSLAAPEVAAAAPVGEAKAGEELSWQKR